MPVNNVQRINVAKPAQMSELERIGRTVFPIQALEHDIGKALLEGKNFKGAVNEAKNKRSETIDANKAKFQEQKKAIEEYREKHPILGYLLTSTVAYRVATLFLD